MAEEQDKTESNGQAAEEASAEATPEEPTPEAPAEDSVSGDEDPGEPEAGASEAKEGSGEAERAGAEDPVGSDEDPAEPEAAVEDSAGNDEQLGPKQLRKLERSRAGGPPGPQLDPEGRAAQRRERRRHAAEARRRHRRRRREKRGEPGQGTPPAERVPGKRKARLGTVISSGAAKTITVRIERARRDPTYEKVVRRSSTVHAHDERNEANEGDVVRVVETRPLSRTKRWRLVEIVERAR